MAKIERTKNTVTGAVWGIIEKIANIFLPFLVRTILINKLGSEYLGLSSLFSSILQVLNLTELGFGAASVFAMYKPIAEDDYNKVGAFVQYLKKIYRYIGIITFGLGIIFLPFIRSIISGGVPSDINVYILYFIYLVNTTLSYMLFAYKTALLSALQLNRITSKVNLVSNSIMHIVQITALLVYPNYYVYVLLIPVFTIISNFTKSSIVDRKYKKWLGVGCLSEDDKKSITTRLFPLMSTKLAVVLVNSADTIVISAFIGLTEVAIYNNYYYIMTSVCGFLIVAYGAMQAGIGNSLVIDNKDKIYKDYTKFSFINYWIITICTTCLVTLYQPFMQLWVGPKLMLDFKMVILFGVYFYSQTAFRISIVYKDASGIWKNDMARCYASCILNLIINIITVRYWGLYGVIGSSVFVGMFVDPIIIRNVHKFVFEIPAKKSYIALFKNIIITVGVSCICVNVCELFPVSFIGLLARGCVCVLICIAVLYAFYYKDTSFSDAKIWILGKLKK